MTKSQLVKLLETVPSEATLNISINQEDIETVKSARVTFYPNEDSPKDATEFCIDLSIG